MTNRISSNPYQPYHKPTVWKNKAATPRVTDGIMQNRQRWEKNPNDPSVGPQQRKFFALQKQHDDQVAGLKKKISEKETRLAGITQKGDSWDQARSRVQSEIDDHETELKVLTDPKLKGGKQYEADSKAAYAAAREELAKDPKVGAEAQAEIDTARRAVDPKTDAPKDAHWDPTAKNGHGARIDKNGKVWKKTMSDEGGESPVKFKSKPVEVEAWSEKNNGEGNSTLEGIARNQLRKEMGKDWDDLSPRDQLIRTDNAMHHIQLVNHDINDPDELNAGSKLNIPDGLTKLSEHRPDKAFRTRATRG